MTVDTAGLDEAALPAEVKPLLRQMQSSLAQKVVRSLRWRNVPAEQGDSAALPLGALLLTVTISKLNPGTGWQRTAIGFGLGQSNLAVQASLRDGAASADALTSFAASAGSGYKPGAAFAALGMLGGQVVMPVVGGGISAMSLSRLGFEQDANQVAEQVSQHLNVYFRALGWHDWTEIPSTFLGVPAGPSIPR